MLPAILLLGVMLLAAGSASTLLPPRVAAFAIPGLCGLALLLALASRLIGGSVIEAGPLHLSLDGLSAWFLLPLILLGAVGGLRGALTLGTMILALLTADIATFAVGVAAVAATLRPRDPAALAWAACTVAAALLQTLDGEFAFTAIRLSPPGPLREAATMLLALAGLTALAWRPRHDTAPLAAFAAYAFARLVLDLGGPAPVWFALPVLAAGLAGALAGAFRLTTATTLGGGSDGAMLGQTGLVVAGFGTALAARGADLPALAAVALAGSLLLLLTAAIAAATLRLAAAAVEAATGSAEFGQLGGLLARMPRTGAAALLAAASLAGIPPFAGFAGLFLIWQALVAGSRIGGLAAQLGFATAVAASGLATATLAAGALRLTGLAWLGLPRSAAAASAHDPGRLGQAALAGVSALAVLLGLWPAAALWLMRPALHQLAAPELVDATSYLPFVLALILALFGVAVVIAVRLSPAPAARHAPIWSGGLSTAPTPPDHYARGLLTAIPRPALQRPSLQTCLALAALALLVGLSVLATR